MYSQEDIFREADFSDFEEVFRSFGFDPFGGMFGSMFGMRGHGGRMREYGADLETALGVSLEEAAKGVKSDISYHRSKACQRCDGSGSEPGSERKVCSACGGRGQVQQARRAGVLFLEYGEKAKPAVRPAGDSGEGLAVEVTFLNTGDTTPSTRTPPRPDWTRLSCTRRSQIIRPRSSSAARMIMIAKVTGSVIKNAQSCLESCLPQADFNSDNSCREITSRWISLVPS